MPKSLKRCATSLRSLRSSGERCLTSKSAPPKSGQPGPSFDTPSLGSGRREQTLLSKANVKRIAAFYADPFHTWQEEYWGAQHQNLSRREYRRGFELAIMDALRRVQFGEVRMEMNRA